MQTWLHKADWTYSRARPKNQTFLLCAPKDFSRKRKRCCWQLLMWHDFEISLGDLGMGVHGLQLSLLLVSWSVNTFWTHGTSAADFGSEKAERYFKNFKDETEIELCLPTDLGVFPPQPSPEFELGGRIKTLNLSKHSQKSCLPQSLKLWVWPPFQFSRLPPPTQVLAKYFSDLLNEQAQLLCLLQGKKTKKHWRRASPTNLRVCLDHLNSWICASQKTKNFFLWMNKHT